MANPNQPKEYDAVLGGQNLPPAGSAILGGIEGVKRRLTSVIEGSLFSNKNYNRCLPKKVIRTYAFLIFKTPPLGAQRLVRPDHIWSSCVSPDKAWGLSLMSTQAQSSQGLKCHSLSKSPHLLKERSPIETTKVSLFETYLALQQYHFITPTSHSQLTMN